MQALNELWKYVRTISILLIYGTLAERPAVAHSKKNLKEKKNFETKKFRFILA